MSWHNLELRHITLVFKHCLPLFRILNHIGGPSGALIVFVQLKIIDKSEGSCFKLTTPYLVIILSGSCGVPKQRVLFIFMSRLLLWQLMSIARCDSQIYPKGNKISRVGTAWNSHRDAPPLTINHSNSQMWCRDNHLNFWVDLSLMGVIKLPDVFWFDWPPPSLRLSFLFLPHFKYLSDSSLGFFPFLYLFAFLPSFLCSLRSRVCLRSPLVWESLKSMGQSGRVNLSVKAEWGS